MTSTVDLRLCPRCLRLAPGATACRTCDGPLTVAPPEALVGRQVDRYRIDGVVGAGGMGIVYSGEHVELGRRVALKVLQTSLEDPKRVERFRLEARVLANLRHPGIVEIWDFDTTSLGAPFYAMELLPGKALADLLAAAPGGLSDRRAAGILRQIGDALAHAHSQGVVHRDVKPANVLVGPGDRTKVLDFGLALWSEPGVDAASLTRTGFLVGTPAYLAPEQILGREAGPATDQFALGLLAFETITGRSPRSDWTATEIVARVQEPPLAGAPGAAALRPDVAAVLDRATRVDPGERFDGVGDFVAALTDVLAPGSGSDVRFSGSTTARGSAETGESAEPEPLETAAFPISGDGPKAISDQLPTIPLAAAPPTRPVADPAVDGTPLAPRQRRGAIAAAALALVTLGLAWAFLLTREPAPSPVPEVAAEDTIPVAPGFVGDQALPVPAGTTAVVAESGDQLLLATGRDAALWDADGGRVVERMSLGDGTRIPAADPLRLATRDPDGRVRVGDPFAGEDEILEPGTGRAVALLGDGALLTATPDAWYVEQGDLLHELPVLAADPGAAIGATDRWVAIGEDDAVVFRSLVDGRETARVAVRGGRGHLRVAFGHFGSLAAIGGWFDGITLVDLETGAVVDRVSIQGRTAGLAVLPGPLVVVAKEDGLRAWRPGRGVVAEWPNDDGSIAALWYPGRGGVLRVLETGSRLRTVRWTGLAEAPRRRLGGPVWAVASQEGEVFAGGPTGTLFRVPAGWHDPIDERAVHTQGLTALAVADGRLISASDDRTLAVWSLPSLDLTWRAPVHDFLVNWIGPVPERGQLWTSSSDGTLRRWGWPDLEPVEEIPFPDRSLHACWVDPSGQRLLVGTWNHEIRWRNRTDDIEMAFAWPSQAAYAITPVEGADAAFVVGIRPSAVGVFDLRTPRLLRLDGLPFAAIAALSLDPTRVLVAGDQGLATIRLERSEDGGLRATLESLAVDGTLGNATAATRLSTGWSSAPTARSWSASRRSCSSASPGSTVSSRRLRSRRRSPECSTSSRSSSTTTTPRSHGSSTSWTSSWPRTHRPGRPTAARSAGSWSGPGARTARGRTTRVRGPDSSSPARTESARSRGSGTSSPGGSASSSASPGSPTPSPGSATTGSSWFASHGGSPTARSPSSATPGATGGISSGRGRGAGPASRRRPPRLRASRPAPPCGEPTSTSSTSSSAIGSDPGAACSTSAAAAGATSPHFWRWDAPSPRSTPIRERSPRPRSDAAVRARGSVSSTGPPRSSPSRTTRASTSCSSTPCCTSLPTARAGSARPTDAGPRWHPAGGCSRACRPGSRCRRGSTLRASATWRPRTTSWSARRPGGRSAPSRSRPLWSSACGR